MVAGSGFQQLRRGPTHDEFQAHSQNGTSSGG
jgi:hypothetical protein